MKPSPYQQAIYSALITTNSHIAIAAGPGCAKSTTLVECAKLLPYGKKAVFLAFNRHIVKELKERLPGSVQCLTLHSLGARALGDHYQNGWFLNEKKQIKYIFPYFEEKVKENKKKWADIYQIDKTMALARSTMTYPNKEGIDKLIANYAIDLEEDNIEILIKALRDLNRYNEDPYHSKMEIDFTDMISLCATNKEINMPQYDYVMVDEAADLSIQDRIFVNRLVKPGRGRKIVVGDVKQSIYSFRGTSLDSFDQFSKESNTITLPLSVCYRCAKNIVKEARKVYDDLEEWDQQILGVVRKGEISEIEEGDFVIARNTRPLVDVFFKLLDAGKKAYILGSDASKGLMALISDFYSTDECNTLIVRLNGKLEQLYKQLLSKQISNPLNHPKYVILEEKIAILKLLFSKFTYVSDVEGFIRDTFDDENRQGIMLSTIHRVKGMEVDRCFVIEKYEGKNLIPSQFAITEDQLTSERNLKFVSLTRAKKELVILHL